MLSIRHERERVLNNKIIEIKYNGVDIICNRIDIDIAEKMLSRKKSSNVVKRKLYAMGKEACPSHPDPEWLGTEICNVSISYVKEKWCFLEYNVDLNVNDFFIAKDETSTFSRFSRHFDCPEDEYDAKSEDEHYSAMDNYYKELKLEEKYGHSAGSHDDY